MPAPITHIVLAEKIFKKHFGQKDRAEFMIGTSLSDIRYFDNLDRSQTHFLGLKLADIQKEDSFMAGFKFHSLVDETHDRFFSFKDNPFFLEPIHITATSLKFFEDELFRDCVLDWAGISDFFGRRLKEEAIVISDEESVMIWQKALGDYFLAEPSPESRQKILQKTNFPDDIASQVEKFIDQMKKRPEIKEVAQEFYDNFERLI